MKNILLVILFFTCCLLLGFCFGYMENLFNKKQTTETVVKLECESKHTKCTLKNKEGQCIYWKRINPS